jgi:5'-nucleotidase
LTEFKPIALVDMDGTVADYDAALRRDLAKLRSPEETGPPVIHGSKKQMPEFFRNRVNMIRSQSGWWENLGTRPDGFQIVSMLKRLGFEIHVLTKGPEESTNAFTEKARWCQKHLPGVPITLTEKKAMVYGRVLVDDWPPYVEPWLATRPRGLAVMPNRDWNKDFSHPNLVRAFVDPNTGLLANYDEVFERLRHAAERQVGKS